MFAFGGVGTPAPAATRRSCSTAGASASIRAARCRSRPAAALTGRVGPLQPRRAEHPDRRRAGGRRRRATNFSVVRVKRDILRRSSIGAHRHRPIASPRRGTGANQAYGVDGTFAFFNNLAINTYWARTQTDGVSRRRHELSRAARLHRRSLRPAARAPGRRRQLQPGGRLRAARRHARSRSAQFRFSPRPQREPVGAAILVDRHRGLHRERRRPPRDARLARRVRHRVPEQRPLQRRLQRHLRVPAAPLPHRRADVPVGGYDYAQRAGRRTTSGSSGRLSGNVSLEHGTFYNGHKTTLDDQPGPR